MELVIIAAIGKNYELGKGNDLIWKFKEDMKFFKEHTLGKPVVMGRKTFQSLPGILPNRKNIVLSRNDIVVPSLLVIHSKEELFDLFQNYSGEVMVIGGASIYEMFLPDTNKMLLTEINDTCSDCDSYFPRFDMDEWDRRVDSVHEENGISFCHVEYQRKLVKR